MAEPLGECLPIRLRVHPGVTNENRTPEFPVVLENNNEHLTQLSAEGLPLFRESLQQDVRVSYPWVGPGEPGSAAVQAVRQAVW